MKRIAFSAYRRFFISLFAVAGLAFMALMWKGALPGGARSLKASMLFTSKPVVNVHVIGAEIPTMALLNDEFCYTARISNTGGTDPGFAPYIRLITPIGVSLTSATLLNVSNTGSGNEQSTFTFTPPTPTAVGPLPIQDPLLPPGSFVQGSGQLWIIQPPIGSVVSGQSAIDIRICLRVTAPTLVNQQLQITHRPVYLYGTGTIAADNQSFVFGDEVFDQIMPVVVKFRKVVLNAPVNDTAGQAPFELLTGECNPVTFQLVADIATTVTLNNLVFNDLFPAVSGAVGLELTKNPSKQVKIITPGGGSKVVTANLVGNVLSVSEPSASGVLVSNVPSDQDVIVEFQANVPKAFFNNSSNTANCPLQNLTNTATFDAQYNGLSISQLSSSLNFTVKVASLQKTASPVVAAPGDTINFALKIIVSESDTLEVIDIDDVLPDGLTYVSNSVKLMINGNDVSNLLTVNYIGNTLKIHIQNGASITPIFGACVLNEITYQAVVDQNYPDGAHVLAGDKLLNVASMGYGRFTNEHKQCYPINGYTEKAASQVVIRPVNEVTKSIINNPLPAQFLPGDEVMFSLKMCIPSGDAKGIMFKDYLPAEFFDAATVTSTSVISFIQTPSGNATLIGPTPDPQDNSVMFAINPDPFTTNPTTPTCFEVRFKVKVANKTFPSALTITNYLLAKTGTEDQHTAGVTLTIGQSNPVLTITKSICSVGAGAAGTVNSSGNVDGADAGDKLTYCITIKNESQSTAYGVTFMDTVPTGLTYVVGSFTGAALDTGSPPPALKTLPQQLAPGGTIIVQYMATVNNTAAPCQLPIKNTAKVEWASSSTSPPTSSATDTAEASFAALPTIMKTVQGQATNPKATIGETITYEIKVCLPEGTASNLVITDTFPSNNLTPISVTVVPPINNSMTITTPGNINTLNVAWTFSQIIVSGNNDTSDNCFTIEVKAKVKDDPLNKNNTVIKNAASMTVPECSTTSSASVDLTVVEPVLDVKKEFIPNFAQPGDTVQVKITVTNTGSSDAFGLLLQDALKDCLVYQGSSASQQGYMLSFSQTTGVLTVVGGQSVSIKPGADNAVMINVTVKVSECCSGINTAAATATTLPDPVPGERTVTGQGSDELVVTGKNCPCTEPPDDMLGSRDMVNWWTFDETAGTTANDIRDKVNNAGAYAAGSAKPAPAPGVVKGGLYFDGGDYVEVGMPDDSEINFGGKVSKCGQAGGAEDLTIDLWLKSPTSLTTGLVRTILDKRAVVDNTAIGYALFLNNGRVGFQMNGVNFASSTTPIVTDDKWHFIAIAVARCGTAPQGRIYIDGKVAHTFTPSGNALESLHNSGKLQIGRRDPAVTPGGNYITGTLDELEFYKRALIEEELDQIYLAGSGGKCKTKPCPTPSFKEATKYDIHKRPYALAPADFNNDGNMDLAVIATSQASVATFEGKFGGIFKSPIAKYFANPNITGPQPRDIAAGNFNSDNRPDLVIAGFTANKVFSVRNLSSYLGALNFGPTFSYITGVQPIHLTTGHFNADNRLDVGVVNFGSNDARILLGLGTYNFNVRPAIPTDSGSGNYFPTWVEAGDHDGNSKMDLLVTNSATNHLALLDGDNLGNLTLTNTLNSITKPVAVAVGDFNGDGKLDSAVANEMTNDVRVFDGAILKQLIPGVGVKPTSIVTGDLNCDGILDLVAGTFSNNSTLNNVAVLIGNGDATFDPPVYFMAGAGVQDVALADMNNDGRLDIITANYESSTVSVLLNNCMCACNPPSLTVEPISQTLCTGSQATFHAVAVGNQPMTVQWEESTDNGATWTPITAATSTTFTTSDSSKLFRAIFKNSCGELATNPVSVSFDPNCGTGCMPCPSNILRVGSEGGIGELTIQAPAEVSWTFTSNRDWIIPTSSPEGVGNGSVGVQILPNPLIGTRTGTMFFAGKQFEVAQDEATTMRVVRVVAPPSATPGSVLNVPIEIVAQGNENRISFSLGFTAGLLSNPQATLGTGAGNATLEVDAESASGRLGVTLELPPGEMFAAGTKQLLNVAFNVAVPGSGVINATVGFDDQPLERVIQDASGNVLPSGFTGASIPFSVVCQDITINPSSLPNGTVGLLYNQPITATGGVAPYTFRLSTGVILRGAILSPAGVLSGTPAAAGMYNFTVEATDASGCKGSRAYSVTVGGGPLMFYPLSKPLHLLDTRPAAVRPGPAFEMPNAKIKGLITGGTPRVQQAEVTFDGMTIPANASAIVGTATVINNPDPGAYAGTGNVTFYPNGKAKPEVSNLNYAADQTISNSFTVGLGDSGAFDIFTYSDVHLVIDVVGYYAPPGEGGLYFHTLPKPVRKLETRPELFYPGCETPRAKLQAGSTRTMQGRFTCDGVTIPATAQALSGNLTAVNAEVNGQATIFAGDLASAPRANSLSYVSTQAIPNAFVTRLAADGDFKLFVSQTTDLLVDVTGYFSPDANDINGQGLMLTLLDSPVRKLETRTETFYPGCITPRAPLAGGGETVIPVHGSCDGATIPDSAKAIIGNATVINFLSPGSGNVTLYPTAANRPEVSNLNYVSDQVIPNAFSVGLSNDGKFTIYVFSTIHLLIDISGYYAP